MRARRLAAALVLAAAGCSTSPGAPAPQVLPPVQDATGLPGSDLVAAAPAAPPVRVEHTARTYLLGAARRVEPGGRPGLLLVLPAANTTLREEYDRYRLDDLRDHGLSVAVVGTYAGTWNAGACCGRPHAEGVPDADVVAQVRDDALRRTDGDPERVAVTGHSVGALMAWRLVCEPGFGAAAVVAVSGTLVHPCPDPLPDVPHVLALHGARDTSVPLDGSPEVSRLLGVAPPSLREAVRRVQAAAGCAADGSACAGSGSVQLSVLPDVGHEWLDLDATRRAAGFLAEVLPGVR